MFVYKSKEKMKIASSKSSEPTYLHYTTVQYSTLHHTTVHDITLQYIT